MIQQRRPTTGPRSIPFHTTAQHPCSYLKQPQAATLFVDPSVRLNNQIYSQLAAFGFRRSGEYIYRPACPTCEACVPLRIPVHEFRPRRKHSRTWRRNQDLKVQPTVPSFNPEHYCLYRKYISTRHPGAGMDQDDPEAYLKFLTSPWGDTTFYEFRLSGKLLAVAVLDRLKNALSAVYTFFDPDHDARSLGTYAILWEIHEAQRLGLSWLYLGYWIKESPKMAYKNEFRPHDAYQNSRWLRIE